MRKIIDGKAYDTNTAKLIGKWWNGDGGLDDCSEHLYQTRKGAFFLYGSGGPRSIYGKPDGYNSYCSGSSIIPYTVEEAKNWAEEHLSASKYEEAFGAVPEA